MSQWVYLSVAIAAEVTGTSFLKSSQGFTRPGPSAVVVIGYPVTSKDHRPNPAQGGRHPLSEIVSYDRYGRSGKP